MEMTDGHEEFAEIDLRELLGHLIDKWWLILLAVCLAAGLAYYTTTAKIAPVYTAQSTIFIGQDSANALSISMEQLNLDNKLITDYQALINTRLISERVIRDLALTLDAESLSSFLKIEKMGDSRFMHISFTDPNADLAVRIVNKYSGVLKEKAESVVGVKNIKIVDYAIPPKDPSGPRVLLNTAIAAMLGFMAAIAIIFLSMMLNNTLQKEEEIEGELGMTVLGVIPQFKGGVEIMISLSLITLNEPCSIVAESYKIFRTNLNYLNIDKVKKVIMFTSSVSAEGKTISIVNTAISFAASGKKVLLLECDLRKSRIHKIFKISQMPGLTNILAEKLSLADVVQTIPEYDNLHIITSGPQPPDPSEMLATNAFDRLMVELREIYDIILIDAPPVLSVADASVISRMTDGVVMIIAANQTRKDEARKAKKALENVGAKILGALMCKADIKKHKYYYYYEGKKGSEILMTGTR